MDWVRAQELDHARAVRRATRQTKEIGTQFQLRDSPMTVRGYRQLGMYFSLGEDAMYPRDEAVTKAIWEFDPYVVPLWVNWVFYLPNSTETITFGRHAVGAYNPNLRFGAGEQFNLSIPPYYTGHLPNKLILIWEGEKTVHDLPGAYKPWNWELYKLLRESFVEFKSAKQIVAEQAARVATDERELARLRAEREYVQADLDRYASKVLENTSEVEMKEFALWGRHQSGKPVPRPMVMVGKHSE